MNCPASNFQMVDRGTAPSAPAGSSCHGWSGRPPVSINTSQTDSPVYSQQIATSKSLVGPFQPARLDVWTLGEMSNIWLPNLIDSQNKDGWISVKGM